MKTNKILKTILVITALSLSMYYGLTLNNVNIIDENETIETSGNGLGQSLNIILIIENERDGEIIYRLEKDDDLALKSLAGFMHFITKGADVEESTLYSISTGLGSPFSYSTTRVFTRKEAEIHIGTGTTAPTYDDWSLETKIYEDNIEALGYSVDGLQMNATYFVTFNIDDTYAITECGFQMAFFHSVLRPFMIFRDVFSAINVISGDLLTVKYVIMFN